VNSVSAADWLVPLPGSAVAELEALVEGLRRDPLPTLLLSPPDSGLACCREAMAEVGARLRGPAGLAVLDRVPVERFSEEESRAIGWVLGSLLSRLVAQKWDGTMLYGVRDTGKQLEYGVRRSVTNLELQFHTDAPWLALPPEHVGLLCLNRAPEGGVSRFVSLTDAHDALGRQAPGLLKRLYQPFPFDRQAEHAPDDDKVGWQPVFSDGASGLICRYNRALIETGAELAGTTVDAEGREALEAMRAMVESPERWIELTIERGQLQYLDNRRFAHARTPFKDGATPETRRHLIRLWNRDEGRRTFHG
jgi:alpha-ketoglutarate-dependent taurine dioxygenase